MGSVVDAISGITGGLLGIKQPEMPKAKEAPKTEIDPSSARAREQAMLRAKAANARRGRDSLRVDLDSASVEPLSTRSGVTI